MLSAQGLALPGPDPGLGVAGSGGEGGGCEGEGSDSGQETRHSAAQSFL